MNTSLMVEMADRAARGLDRHGFILPEVCLARVRPPYPPVIAALRGQCRDDFLSDFHSLYLSGSVVKGTARPGQSDLDALAVLQVAPTPAHEESARRIADAVAERFPFVTEVGLLLAGRGAILSEEQRNDMGFFVKCLSVCVAGEDLGEDLPRYRPSVALARGTNGNIRLLLADRRRRLVSTSDPADVAAICRGITRKIVRTGFTLVMPRYQGWTSDLERSANIFAAYYPSQSAAMQEALILAQVPSTEKAPVLALIDSFGAWLADEYDRVILGTGEGSRAARDSSGCLEWMTAMVEGERYETEAAEPRGRTTIATAIPALRLVALSPDDAAAYYELVDRNRTHLTQHGDWTDLGDATPESVQASLSDSDDHNAQFGIWMDGRLIGRTDLNARTPGNFVLSYWLGGEFTGKGYATAACEALIEYGKTELGARNVYAGVTKGNAKSEALLGRLGFDAVEDRGTYTRFRLSLL